MCIRDRYKIAYWTENANAIAQRIKKGNMIFVTGRLKPSAYIDDDGKVNASLDVNARVLQLMTPKDEPSR